MAGWIFQGNPRRFDVNQYLVNVNPITWTLNPQYRNSIAIGDTVFLWRSDGSRKGSGGVVALGTVSSEPKWISESELPGVDLWKDPANVTEPTLKIEIMTEEVRLTPEQGMLLRIELLNDENLSRLSVLTFKSASNFRLTEEQFDLPIEMWDPAGFPEMISSCSRSGFGVMSREYGGGPSHTRFFSGGLSLATAAWTGRSFGADQDRSSVRESSPRSETSFPSSTHFSPRR